ncbi:TPA: hypothetical protein EYO12_02410 [Candidatus Saccharibacteria bacterium]|nr:hypothetical protein [Candidatus Saccharibacteria bacterium]HIO87646.1 hypothetical protein [Candidatus Saccharibacteria bacterium]
MTESISKEEAINSILAGLALGIVLLGVPYVVLKNIDGVPEVALLVTFGYACAWMVAVGYASKNRTMRIFGITWLLLVFPALVYAT